MNRIKMIWWILTKKDVSIIARGKHSKYEYYSATTTNDKDYLTMACRQCQFAHSNLYHKEFFPEQLCNRFKLEE